MKSIRRINTKNQYEESIRRINTKNQYEESIRIRNEIDIRKFLMNLKGYFYFKAK